MTQNVLKSELLLYFKKKNMVNITTNVGHFTEYE